MARSQAKIHVSAWGEPEWRDTPAMAQRLYWLLLSQSRLNLAGVLDLMPERWAAMAPDTDVAQIERDLADLARRRYVIVDRDTGEVAIRTFTRHDLASGAINKNLIKGFWSAWEGIISIELRLQVVANLPAEIWEKSDGIAPETALQMRSSLRLEPQLEPQLEPDTQVRFEPSVTTTTTVTANRRPSPTALALEACRLIGEAKFEANRHRADDDDAYRAAIVNNAKAEHYDQALNLAKEHPDWQAGALVEALRPSDPLSDFLNPTPGHAEQTRPQLPEFHAEAPADPDQARSAAHAGAQAARSALGA